MAMTEEHRNVLREKRIQLLKDMKLAEPFLSFFQRDRTLTDEMIAEIKEPLVYTNRERVAKLLDRLPSRGANAFNILIEALVETEQEDLARFLDPNNETIPPSDETDSARRADGDGRTSSEFIVNMIVQNSLLVVRSTANTKCNKQRGIYTTSQSANCKALIVSVSNGGRDNGLDEDKKIVDTLFKGLRFTVHHLTVKQEELEIKLREEASNLSASHEAFVLFVLRCRGNLNVENIFEGNNCKGLSGKPKLMFLQICDTSAGQGRVIPDDPQAAGDAPKNAAHSKSGILTVRIYEKPNVNERSLAVTGLCYTLAEYARYCSITDLLITANIVVSKLKKRKGLEGSGDMVVYRTIEAFFFNLGIK